MRMLYKPLWLCLISLTLAAAKLPPAPEGSHINGELISQLAKPSMLIKLQLSPDGQQIAAISYDGNSPSIITIDPNTRIPKLLYTPRFVIKGYWRYLREPTNIHWVTNTLLATEYNDGDSEILDLETSKLRPLGEGYLGKLHPNDRESEWVLAFRDREDGDINMINARSGEKKRYQINLPGTAINWAFDKTGQLLAVTMRDTAFWSDKTVVSNWYRPNEKTAWEKLAEFPVDQQTWLPQRVLDEPGMLAIWSREGRDTYAIFRYDVAQKKQLDMMAGHPTQDIVQATGIDQPIFESVSTRGLKPERYWFDERKANIQAAIDAALPDNINTFAGDPEKRLLISSYSDTNPGSWSVLEVPAMKLRPIVSARPWLDNIEMRPMETLTYQASDNLSIPAYLTLPKGKGPYPTVILIHGGPQVRDTWGWNEEVQVLAAHGYAVFQPQFRGSSGFGRRFEEAGYGQWGRAMQDDITTGVNYLIEKKIADPQRICIYGASYGGYAALWGAIQSPELYKCAISFAGASDIELLFKDRSDRNSNAIARELQLLPRFHHSDKSAGYRSPCWLRMEPRTSASL